MYGEKGNSGWDKKRDQGEAGDGKNKIGGRMGTSVLTNPLSLGLGLGNTCSGSQTTSSSFS